MSTPSGKTLRLWEVCSDEDMWPGIQRTAEWGEMPGFLFWTAVLAHNCCVGGGGKYLKAG